ncbi:periplasmic heavy metal sensor [Cochlodiniinecator piscidefendens]|uniref:periplasmic heavy metal sensor n=1 Tax=Cochlodiniinecator piscidefendens TaxID=2715756 RepID=UPI0014089826|nr:periplasmic heavy metal sensor [Cochlodiniinecator piscidefendens]
MAEKMDMPKSKRSWGRILLVASLSANLLVVGVAAGAFFKHRGGDEDRVGRPELGIVTMLRALDRDDRAALRTRFENAVQENANSGTHGGLRASNVLEILRAHPFDQQAFVTVLSQQQSRFEQRSIIGRTVLTDQISTMSEAERAAFADRLERRFSQRPYHRRRDH